MVKIKNLPKKIIISIIIALIILGLGIYFVSNRNNNQTPVTEPTDTQPAVNYDPPTKEDSERAESNKDRIIEREKSINELPTNESGLKQVKPIITYAGQYGDSVEVGAYANVFEENGSCTATFTLGSTSVKKTVQSVRNANSTDCPVMQVGVSELGAKGTYSVVVSYNSQSSSGTSDSRQVEVK